MKQIKIDADLKKIFKKNFKIDINKKNQDLDLYIEGKLDSFDVVKLVSLIESVFNLELNLQSQDNLIISFSAIKKIVLKKIK